MKSIVLFNNKSGVGTTTLTFSIAHMMAHEGWRVAVLDYDPQCSITALLLDEELLVGCWQADGSEGATVGACIEPVRRGDGDVITPRMVEVAPGLWLLPGHLSLSGFEQTLAEQWPKTMAADDERALAVTTALDRLSNLAAERADADVLLVDLGPSLGALNRAALLACDHVIVPVVPDSRWAERIPGAFHEHMLGEPAPHRLVQADQDPCCIAQLRPFATLVPYARQARKPMFDLRQADGVSGGQTKAVLRCRAEFEHLVDEIALRAGVPRP
jgi:chromosome partitioning protein